MTPQRIENIRRFHQAFVRKVRTDPTPLNMSQQVVLADMLGDLIKAAERQA